MEQDLVVNEIFGPTVQGEGRSLGRRCAFLRLGGCNLSCSWCDTPYTWDWTGAAESGIAHDPRKELHRRPVEEVVAELVGFDTDLIVISGGEPLGQQERLIPLVAALTERGIEIEIETNGTHAAHPELVAAGVRFNVSPKLSHSGDPRHRRIVPSALTNLRRCRKARSSSSARTPAISTKWPSWLPPSTCPPYGSCRSGAAPTMSPST